MRSLGCYTLRIFTMIGIQQTVGDNRPPLLKLRPPQIVGAGDAGEGFSWFFGQVPQFLCLYTREHCYSYYIFLYVECKNWAKNIEITTRFLYLQCFSDVSTSALEIIQSYAAAHADRPKMPICWYLECFYFLQPAVIHLCKNRYFWPNVFCCFFRLKTSSKCGWSRHFFNVTFTNKKTSKQEIL